MKLNPQPTNKLKFLLLVFIYFLFIAILPTLATQIIALYTGQAVSDLPETFITNLYIIFQLICAGIALFMYRKEIYHDLKRLTFGRVLLAVSLGFVLRIILTLIFVYVLVGDVQSDNQQALEQMFSNTSPLIMFLLVCIQAPIVEELVFRHGIIGQFKDWLPVNLLSIISLLLFAYIHSPLDIQGAMLYIPISVSIVLIYRFFDNNVVAAMWMHFANNALALLAMVVTSMNI